MGVPSRTRTLFSLASNPAVPQASFVVNVSTPASSTPAIGLTGLIFVASRDASVTAIADARGNTWVKDLERNANLSGTVLHVSIWRSTSIVPLQPEDAVTFTVPGGTTRIVAGGAEYTGLLYTASPKDTQSSADDGGTASTTPSSGSASNTTSNALLAGLIGHLDGPVGTLATPGAGWAGIVSGNAGTTPDDIGFRCFDRVVSVIAAYAMDGTFGSAVRWEALIQIYKTDQPNAPVTAVAALSATIPASATVTAVATLAATATLAYTIAANVVAVATLTGSGGASNVASASIVAVARLRAGRLYDLWNDLGLLIGRLNAFATLAQGNLDAGLLRITNNFIAKESLEGIYGTYDGFGATFTGLRTALAAFADVRLLNVDRVLRELQLDDSASVDDTIEALGLRMQEDNVTLNRSVVTLGSVTADQNNYGNGIVLLTKVLDGVTAPGVGFPSHSHYNGVDSELAVPSEGMIFVCVADAEADGLSEGAEEFSWRGTPDSGQLSWEPEGSDEGPGVTAAGGLSVLTGGDMESFSANVPTGWDLDSGAAGTHVFQDATTRFRGASALRLRGDGTTTIQLSQTLSSILTPRKRYALVARVRASSQPAGATLTIQFAGTSYTAAASEKISVAGASFSLNQWALSNAWINVPGFLHDDFELRISVAGLPVGVDVWLDDVFVVEATYHAGVGLVVVPGSSPFLRADQFDWPVSSVEGTFQQFFRRWWKSMLPSSASPTVSDSLAAP